MPDRLLTEDGFGLLLEDGSDLLLESSAPPGSAAPGGVPGAEEVGDPAVAPGPGAAAPGGVPGAEEVGDPSAGEPPAPDFFAGYLAWVSGDPVLAAAFPGGFLQGKAAAAQALPFCRVTETDPNRPVTPDDREYYPAVEAVATSDDDAVRLGNLVVARLRDPARAAFAYLEPDDPRVWRSGAVLVEPPGSAPILFGYVRGGTPLWSFQRRFTVRTVADPS